MATSLRSPAHAHILSPHPFVLEELSHRVAPAGVPVTRVRLPYTLAAPADVTIPGGSLCVIDACFPLAATESLVSSLLVGGVDIRVLVIAEELTDWFAFLLLRLGVKGFLSYEDVRRQLLPALAALAKGGLWVPRSLLSRFVDALRSKKPVGTALQSRLTRREQDVLDDLLQNLSNKEIAVHLNISERTVKFHVSNLLSKFSVQRRADLVLHLPQAGRFGLVAPDSPIDA